MFNLDTQTDPHIEGAELHTLTGSSAPGAMSSLRVTTLGGAPDAELFAKFAELKIAEARRDASQDALADANDKHEEPEPPEALFRQPCDDGFFPPSIYRGSKWNRHWFGGEFQDGLNGVRLSDNIPEWRGPAQDMRVRYYESGERRLEITAAWSRWTDDLKAARDAVCLDELEASCAQVWTEVTRIEREILKFPAVSWDGILLKAGMFGNVSYRTRDLDRRIETATDFDGSVSSASVMLDLARIIESGGASRVQSIGNLGAHLPSPDLDKPIVDAWAEYQRISSLLTVALDHEANLEKQYDAERPRRPNDLAARAEDFPGDSIRFLTDFEDGVGFYKHSVVERLRAISRTRLLYMRPLEGGAECDGVYDRVPHVEDQQRADQVVAVYDAWVADCERFRDTIGLFAAAAKAEALGDELYRVGSCLRDGPALSLLGLQIKASWALTLTGDGEEDMRSVLQQVEDFARRHQHLGRRESQAVPDHETLEAYRTWLSNEFRSLTAEMYPDQPEMTGMIAVNNAGDRFHFRGEPAASTRAERVLGMFGVDLTSDAARDQQAAA